MTKQSLIDSNVILRFLIEDGSGQAQTVKNFFATAKVNSLVVPDLIIAEVVYVLESFYKTSKVEIADKLSSLIELDVFDLNRRLIIKTLDFYSNSNLDYADSYLTILARRDELEKVYTFDKAFIKKVEQASLPV